jgi:hypothetical protein
LRIVGHEQRSKQPLARITGGTLTPLRVHDILAYVPSRAAHAGDNRGSACRRQTPRPLIDRDVPRRPGRSVVVLDAAEKNAARWPPLTSPSRMREDREVPPILSSGRQLRRLVVCARLGREKASGSIPGGFPTQTMRMGTATTSSRRALHYLEQQCQRHAAPAQKRSPVHQPSGCIVVRLYQTAG